MLEVRAEWSECEMVNVTPWPPPGLASQQPLVSPKPDGPVPVKSLSSQVMKMTELPFQALEFIIWPTVELRKASPVAMSCCSLEKLQGSDAGAPRPCMSWHWSGLIQE